jgi:hypothetical protein
MNYFHTNINNNRTLENLIIPISSSRIRESIVL